MLSILLVALFMGVKAQNPDAVDFSMRAPVRDDSTLPIVTRHIPSNLHGDLKLTTGDLKVFAGHALNIIRSKCNNVDSQKLFQVQKYIGKRISDTEPTRGGKGNQAFQELISKMSVCGLQKPSPIEPTPTQEKSETKTFVVPLQSVSSWFSFVRWPTTTLKSIFEDDEITLDQDPNVEVEKIDVSSVGNAKDSNAESTLDKWHALSHEEKKQAVDSIFDDDLGKFVSDFPVTSEEPVAEVVTQKPAVYTTHIFIPRRASPGFLAWISNIWSSMSEFFGRIFGMGGRRKRDTDDLIGDDQERNRRMNPTMNRDPNPGRTAFIELIDEICRIYCDTCSVHSLAEMNNFKLAARDLLKFILEDKTGVDLVANHFMDPQFMRSLNMCQPPSPRT